MERRVIHEVRLSNPLMAVAVIVAFGLLAIGLRPVIEVTPAFTYGHEVHRVEIVGQVAICDLCS